MAENRHDDSAQDRSSWALTLRLMPGLSAADWQVTRFYPDTEYPLQHISSPQANDSAFLRTLHQFWQLSRQVLTEAAAVETLHRHAVAVGGQLARVLTSQDRDYLATPPADGVTPCLIIESTDEAILSLPWELIHLSTRTEVLNHFLGNVP